eukprot:CAMPEP_0174934576 /NCGR_PEP_ID=MMETSP1355-20121228/50078_1 /TAXON_ID=464990 /ORGANISM="Hemiselmis tepida, Strain CCMP443" /LENGTH=103 /DNA_ID=CAMNT_0016181191 /DNA_START=29 /DNA_END=337 /DNA_ORIENTATION=+
MSASNLPNPLDENLQPPAPAPVPPVAPSPTGSLLLRSTLSAGASPMPAGSPMPRGSPMPAGSPRAAAAPSAPALPSGHPPATGGLEGSTCPFALIQAALDSQA